MDIGEKLKNERKKFKYTIRDLSELTGISISAIKSYENGYVKNISIDNLKLLSNVFMKDPNYFLLNEYDLLEGSKKADFIEIKKKILLDVSKTILNGSVSKEKTKEFTDFINKFFKENFE